MEPWGTPHCYCLANQQNLGNNKKNKMSGEKNVLDNFQNNIVLIVNFLVNCNNSVVWIKMNVTMSNDSTATRAEMIR